MLTMYVKFISLFLSIWIGGAIVIKAYQKIIITTLELIIASLCISLFLFIQFNMFQEIIMDFITKSFWLFFEELPFILIGFGWGLTLCLSLFIKKIHWLCFFMAMTLTVVTAYNYY